jgi:hypothetical protein
MEVQFTPAVEKMLNELADFGIDLDLFHDGGVSGGDGLDLGIGESAAFDVWLSSSDERSATPLQLSVDISI